MTAPKPRLLACGFCFEEEGEEVHPHPECPVGRVALADQAKYDALVAEADRLRREGAALHARAEGIDRQLAALQQQVAAPVDRAAVLHEEADRIDATRADFPIAVQNGITWATAELRRHAAEVRRVADETTATETAPVDLPALAAALDGFGTLLATSSRDWGVYRVDAWLYAVILGWDCEETEHDDTCTHGALEEMQQQHGWDAATVAKARRYRAAVRALIETHQPAAGARQDGADRG